MGLSSAQLIIDSKALAKNPGFFFVADASSIRGLVASHDFFFSDANDVLENLSSRAGKDS